MMFLKLRRFKVSTRIFLKATILALLAFPLCSFAQKNKDPAFQSNPQISLREKILSDQAFFEKMFQDDSDFLQLEQDMRTS